MPIAQPHRRRIVREVDAGLVAEQRHHRVEHRDVHLLAATSAFTREQRRGHALRGEHPRHDVGNGHAEAVGRTVGRARDAHKAAFRLHHRVVAGFVAARPRVAEARNRAVDQPRIAFGDRGVVEAELVERAGTEVLDHHVGLREQLLEQRTAVGVLEVESDALLVPVDAQEV